MANKGEEWPWDAEKSLWWEKNWAAVYTVEDTSGENIRGKERSREKEQQMQDRSLACG